MLGKSSDQRGLSEADHLYLDLVGRESFYGRLAGLRGQLFRDEDFASFQCQDNGRSSVPPGHGGPELEGSPGCGGAALPLATVLDVKFPVRGNGLQSRISGL